MCSQVPLDTIPLCFFNVSELCNALPQRSSPDFVLILSEIKHITDLPLFLKWSENLWCSEAEFGDNPELNI